MSPRAVHLLGLLLLTGCGGWAVDPAPVPIPADHRFVGSIRITDTTGHRRPALAGAVVRGATLLYARPDGSADSVPVGAVARIERRETHAYRTLGLLTLILVPGVMAIGLATSF